MCGPGGILQDKRNLKSSRDSPSFMLVACDWPCLTHPAGDLYHGKDLDAVFFGFVVLTIVGGITGGLISTDLTTYPIGSIFDKSTIGAPDTVIFSAFSFFRFCPRLPDTLA